LPSDRVVFLSRDEALAIHSTLLERFGGPAGVRDHGLLESALYRPQTGHYADLAEMSAALFESLIMNHPRSTPVPDRTAGKQPVQLQSIVAVDSKEHN